MKLTVFAAYCFLMTIHSSVEGGLVKDFFGKVKETAEVIHKDVKQVWRPDDTNKENPEHGDKVVTEATLTTTEPAGTAKDNQAEKKEVSKVTEKTPEVNEKKSDEPTTSSSTTTTTVEAVKENKQEEPTTKSEKDGRENFTGGCITGYKRVADGRCMPSF